MKLGTDRQINGTVNQPILPEGNTAWLFQNTENIAEIRGALNRSIVSFEGGFDSDDTQRLAKFIGFLAQKLEQKGISAERINNVTISASSGLSSGTDDNTEVILKVKDRGTYNVILKPSEDTSSEGLAEIIAQSLTNDL
jgi:hypothetical protein